MLASTIGVAVIVAAGVLIWRVNRDGSAEAKPETGGWDEVVFVDRANGAVTTVTPDGNDQGSVPATARTLAVYSEGSRVAFVQAGQIVLTDLGDKAPDIVTIDPDSVVSRLAIADSLWLAVSKSTGGNLVLVNGLTGTSYDFAALADQASPRFYVETLHFDSAGKRFAVADANTFQTIVIDTTADPPAATFFAAQPLTLDDRTRRDQPGRRAASGAVDVRLRPDAAGDGHRCVAGGRCPRRRQGCWWCRSMDPCCASDRTTPRPSASARSPSPVEATIKPPIHPSAAGTRLVVFGGVFEAVVDLDGQTVFTTTFTGSGRRAADRARVDVPSGRRRFDVPLDSSSWRQASNSPTSPG